MLGMWGRIPSSWASLLETKKANSGGAKKAQKGVGSIASDRYATLARCLSQLLVADWLCHSLETYSTMDTPSTLESGRDVKITRSRIIELITQF